MLSWPNARVPTDSAVEEYKKALDDSLSAPLSDMFRFNTPRSERRMIASKASATLPKEAERAELNSSGDRKHS